MTELVEVFEDGILDPSLWSLYTIGGGSTSEINGRLECQSPVTNSWGGIRTVNPYNISEGEVTVRCGFLTPPVGMMSLKISPQLVNPGAEGNFHTIYFSSRWNEVTFAKRINGTWTTIAQTPVTIAGIMGLSFTLTGGVVSAFYDAGFGWIKLGDDVLSSNLYSAAYTSIFGASNGQGNGLGWFDNFYVNYGELPPPVYHNLTISASAGGGTQPSPGIYPLLENTEVILAASPDYGYTFVNWVIDEVSYDVNSLKVVMDKDHYANAVFQVAQQPPPPPVESNLLSAITIIIGEVVVGIILITRK